MPRRSVAWVKPDPLGAEFADVEIARGRLAAVGIAVGSSPVGYRLDYKLETLGGYVTTGLLVTARGQGWQRKLDLRRLRSGRWTARTSTRGKVELPPPGGDMAQLGGALDCDLAWSPLTNSMPVLRHELLDAGGPVELLMAWVSVPDLRVIPSVQRYRFMRRSGTHSIIRYESESRDFIADLGFDEDGICVSYPGIGHAV